MSPFEWLKSNLIFILAASLGVSLVGLLITSTGWKHERALRELDRAEAAEAALKSREVANQKAGEAAQVLQEGVTHGKESLDAAIVRSRERVRDPSSAASKSRSQCSPAVDHAASPTDVSAAGREVAERELLIRQKEAAEEELLRLGNEADDVVKQLSACQAALRGI